MRRPTGSADQTASNQRFDLFGLQIARKRARAEVARRVGQDAARSRFVLPLQNRKRNRLRRCDGGVLSRGALSLPELAQEVDDIVRRDVVQVAEGVAEPEGHEAIEEAVTVIDRRLGQPTLIAEICVVFLV